MTPLLRTLLAMLPLAPILVAAAPGPDLILHNGKIVTVDPKFTIATAAAVSDGAFTLVGSDAEILATRTSSTKVIDLEGKTVLPGLIDSHVHPGAAMTEADHVLPDMQSIDDVLSYIRARASELPPGEWIQLRQVFITRLREQRYPTRSELDAAAPRHPVVFATGPDASLNSLALELSGIDRDFKVTDSGPGFAERDPATGDLTGILRSCTRYVKARESGSRTSEQQIHQRTLELFRDYAASGLTTVADRNASPQAIRRYEKMLEQDELPIRLALSHSLGTLGSLDEIRSRIDEISNHPLRRPNPKLRIIGVKAFLDGGMLTGSARMREPWGVSDIYAITDPDYCGLLFIPPDRLLEIVKATVKRGMQFTAHAVGDGAVHTLIDAYEAVNEEIPIRDTRPCLTHSNFMSRESVETAARLGIVVDIQPAWLYLDTRTLVGQFGYDRLRYFQPLKSLFEAGAIAGGGSDHMQKIGSMRAINPYNPFFGIWITLTRQARWYEGQLHPEESLSREQAIRFYTANNAHLLFLEDQIGSIEPGKRADFIIIDRDLLECPLPSIPDTRVLATYVDGLLIP